ncbi:MAG: hypothetical protein RL088_3605 [Verrucomicrobiota bacterium]|jgi:hypothetical protein
MSVRRRDFLATLAALAFPLRAAETVPFPAEALTSIALWDDPKFIERWGAFDAKQRIVCRNWQGRCEALGTKAQGASAFFEEGRLRSISILFLDAGAWFGFAQAGASARVPEFLSLHRQTSANVESALTAAGGKLRDVPLGGRQLLKHTGRVARVGDVWARLVVWPEYFVKLSLFRDEDAATQLLAPYRRTQKRDDQVRAFAALVEKSPNGDQILRGIPMLQQGDRAYCGMSALAMTMQHLGLRIETEELAAAAGIRFGSTQEAKTRETYDDAATVGAMRMDRMQKPEWARIRASISAGMPVVVFRRWSQERDFVHTQFARRFAQDPAAVLPRAGMEERKLWPQRGGFAHASIVNGFNAARGEVIFTESWSEQARDRRMRFEELEGTGYMACHPRLP